MVYRSSRRHLPIVLGLLVTGAAHAQQQRVIEEIIVTARQQAESLQDIPVTVAFLSEEDLKRYNVTRLTDAASMIPNFQIFTTGSGNGSVLRLRGIGSSDISAAFDSRSQSTSTTWW